MKNADKEPQKNTWGHLIKNYNNNARGNVEQFSISSNDSIWEDEERRAEYFEKKMMEVDPDNYNEHMDNYHKMVAYDKYGGPFDGYAHEISVKTYKDESAYSSTDTAGSLSQSREQCFQVGDSDVCELRITMLFIELTIFI